MIPRINDLLAYTFDKRHHALRRDHDWKPLLDSFVARGLSPARRAAEGLREMLAAEQPAFLPGERIAFVRTIRQIPDLWTEDEMTEKRKHAFYAEKGVVFNITPNYYDTIRTGLAATAEQLTNRLQQAIADHDDEGREFLETALSGVQAVRDLARRYREEAERQGLADIAETLAVVPEQPAQTLRQALQFLRILHYALWCEGEYHNGLGRFDLHLYPYLQADLDAGRLNEEQALELVEEFFIACNRDSDLYIGVQQGDNGQSLVLGGVDRQGNPVLNTLTHLALTASRELKVIDPKINLRITPRTSIELLTEASELTAVGLGFPQYSNDDVVIPALVNYGYDLEDARDYTVAACWEFIVPGLGMDIDNITGISLPDAVNTVMHQTQPDAFDTLMTHVADELRHRADDIHAMLHTVDMLPGPFVSTLCDGCIDRARDISRGGKYNNFGIHCTGLATAVDSLMAIRHFVYDDQKLTLAQLADAVDHNFDGQPELLAEARFGVPKMGNDIDVVDDIAVRLLAACADALKGRRNARGGIYRAGTGSAMYYIWHANELSASADGRINHQPFPANYAPSLNVRVNGPISVVKSFTKPDLSKVCNGGPLTIEIHDSMFREPDGTRKLAQVVQYFAQCGGHQLQLNAVNRDQLLDAQKHPEKHRHLIVRVWGWSGYFIELDKPYQDQIIKRVEMTL